MKIVTNIQEENLPTSTEVFKNRVFGMPLTKMTKHQRVSFTAMIKIAYDVIGHSRDQITFEYPTNDFFEMIGISSSRKQSHLFSDMDDWGRTSDDYTLEKTLNELTSKTILFKHKDTEDKTYQAEGVSLLSYFKLTKEKITFRFDEWIRSKIHITDNYYIMKLPLIASFKRGHSVTLFEQLEQRRKYRRWSVEIKTLRSIFGIEHGKYKKFSEFRRNVIELAINEINEKTNYTLKYELIKKGRSVDKIIFTWYINKTSLQEFQSLIRSKFVNIPLMIMTEEEEEHLLQVSEDGKLYNAKNPEYFYPTAQAMKIWKLLYENQDRMLTKKQQDNFENFKESDFSKYYGKNLMFDGDLYEHIILISPSSFKNKLKIKTESGIIVMTEDEFMKNILI